VTISYEEFAKVDLRLGTVVKVEEFPKAKKPAYKVWVDFGPEVGVKQTSAQITVHYKTDELVGMKVIGCINLGTRNIAGFESEFLLTGFPDENGAVCLATVATVAPDGGKLF
jgi:tRNA-binding protein